MSNHQNLKNAITDLDYLKASINKSEAWSEDNSCLIASHIENLKKVIRESAIVPSEAQNVVCDPLFKTFVNGNPNPHPIL